jgi:acyl-homoserine lactone acylase PvdQ
MIAPGLSLLALAVSAQSQDRGADSSVANTTATIRWDEWGVPHIESDTMTGAFYGFGWAQMQLHGDLILELYGRARGRLVTALETIRTSRATIQAAKSRDRA